ncbi:hypothetical protein LCGC14_1830190 [marine sediment metagenome]|uniref:Uncharacterized protein n=1 Tax=marine sediment metagenome TaxID=412755 RepID=A0A0F9GGC2_9ZZZZ
MSETNILRLFLTDKYSLSLEVSLWVIAALVAVPVAAVVARWYWPQGWWPRRRKHFGIVEMEIQLGGVGKVKLCPVVEDIQIAHRIWTELATRKVALPIEPEHDVIVEVYNSWSAMFGKVRELIAATPAELVRSEPSTQELVRIATDTLNKGLRPHLTRWQARFRNWYAQQKEALKTRSPQQVQRDFEQYEELMADMQRVNQQMIQYAGELQKLVHAK